MMDVEKILHKLEEMQYIRLSRITGDYYTIYCPFHKDGQENKPSCGVLLHEQYKNGQVYPAGFFHCFTCQTALTMPEAVTRILKSHNVTKSGLDWLKENIAGFDADVELDKLIPEDMLKNLNASFAVDYILNQIQPSPVFVSNDELASYRFVVPYMYERGLTDELINLYDVGFDANHIPEGRKKKLPCVTFPVKDINGNTLFFCRRSIEGKYFNYPMGVSKPLYGLYELDKSARRIVICESCFNCITARKYGDQAVALLGTGNPLQITQLRRLGAAEFILAFDPDSAGRKATARLKKALSDVALVWSFDGIPEGKDINMLTYDEYKSLLLV